MLAPRTVATAVFGAVVALILLTGLLQEIASIAPAALLVAALVLAAAAAGWRLLTYGYLHRIGAPQALAVAGMVRAAVEITAMLAMQAVAYGLAGHWGAARGEWPPGGWLPIALWATATIVGWSPWRLGHWPLAAMLSTGLAVWSLAWWMSTAGTPQLAWTAPAASAMFVATVLLTVVVLAGALSEPDGGAARRVTNHLATAAAAVVLAGVVTGGVLGYLAGPAATPSTGLTGGGFGQPLSGVATSALNSVRDVLGYQGYGLSELALRPLLLAGLLCAVVLFGRRAGDHIDAIADACTATEPQRRSVAARVAHTILAAALAVTASLRPDTSVYAGLLAAGLGLGVLAVLYAAMRAWGLPARAGAVLLLSGSAAAVAVVATAARFASGPVRYLPVWWPAAGYAAVAAAAAAATWWLRQRHPDLYQDAHLAFRLPEAARSQDSQPGGAGARQRVKLLAAAVVAGVVGALGVVFAVPTSPAEEGRQRLVALAATISAAPYEAASGRFAHTEQVIWADLPMQTRKTHRHTWQATDGSGRTVSRILPYEPLNVDPAQLATDFTDPSRTDRDGWDPTADDARADRFTSLPADPSVDELIARTRQEQQYSNATPAEQAAAMTRRLHDTLPPRALRATILRTLAEVGTFHYIGLVADPAGRLGQGFQTPPSRDTWRWGDTYRLIFDARTGELLADHSDDTRGDFQRLYLTRERTMTSMVPTGEAPCPATSPGGTPDASCQYRIDPAPPSSAGTYSPVPQASTDANPGTAAAATPTARPLRRTQDQPTDDRMSSPGSARQRPSPPSTAPAHHPVTIREFR